MLDRHLLPDEVELLLDDEAGFGIGALRAHVEACGECQARIAVERELVELLEHVPHLAPAGAFHDRVLSQVRVVGPWHVSAMDTLRRFVPPPGPWRTLIGAGLTCAGIIIATALAWIALRFDEAVYTGQLLVSHAQSALITAAGGAVDLVFGDAAAGVLRVAGVPAAVTALAAIGATGLAATLGLRGLVVVARRRRS